MEDDHVDRPDVEGQQCPQLTGTNRSIGLIALIINVHVDVEIRENLYVLEEASSE